MTDTLDSSTLDAETLDAGCVDDSSDPVGSDDSCSDDSCSDDSCSDDADTDTDTDTDTDDGADDGADACGTEGSDDGARDTDPTCWDDTLSAVPSDEVTESAEVAPSTGPAPLVPLPAAALASLPAAPAVSPFAGVPGLGGDTEAILTSVSGRLADAGTIAHAPLGIPGPAFEAAMGRADVAGRAAASMGALAAEQEIVNSVREHELRRSTIEESIRVQGAAERAEDGLP